MENLFQKYLRWRHSKGYGVHSPYAYRFVCDVLNPEEYGFYAYHEIDHEFLIAKGKHELDAKNLKLLYRIIIFLNSKRMVIAGPKLKDLVLLGKIANIPVLDFNKTKEKDLKQNDLIIINHSDISEEKLDKIVEAGIPVLALNPSPRLKTLLAKPMKDGLFLDGTKQSLLIPRKEMAYTSYKINF